MFTSEEDVALYRDAYSPLWGEPEERLVSAAVAPDTTEQVSAVVRTKAAKAEADIHGYSASPK